MLHSTRFAVAVKDPRMRKLRGHRNVKSGYRGRATGRGADNRLTIITSAYHPASILNPFECFARASDSTLGQTRSGTDLVQEPEDTSLLVPAAHRGTIIEAFLRIRVGLHVVVVLRAQKRMLWVLKCPVRALRSA